MATPTRGRRVALLSYHTDPLSPLGGDVTGGMNVYVRELARSLPPLGIGVDVFTRAADPFAPGVVRLAPGTRLIRIPAGPRQTLRKSDLPLHVGPFTDGIREMARAEKTSYDLISAHYWLSGVAGERLSAVWDVPLVVRFHTLASQKNRALPDARAHETDARIASEEGLARRADALFAASPAEARILETRYGVSPERIHLVPCGVDTGRFRPVERARNRLGLKRETALILIVGRIDPIKGLDLLIDSLATMKTHRPGLSFQAVHIGGEFNGSRSSAAATVSPGAFSSPGQRAEVERLLRLASKAGVSKHLSFIGARPHSELPNWYSAADVLAIPSRYESFSLVALEAAACGLPAVAYNVGGLPEAIECGCSGVLIPENDTAAFGQAIERLIEDAEESSRLGDCAKRRAQAYSWPTIASKEMRIWDSLLGSGAVSGAEPANAPGGATDHDLLPSVRE